MSINASGLRADFLRISALLGLLVLTRATHLGSALHLPDAAAAVFFLGGFYFAGSALFSTAAPGSQSRLRPSLFWLFFGISVALDFSLFFAGRTSGFCLTPGYLAMLPAYWILWQGGRLVARSRASGTQLLLTGALSWAAVGSVSYLLRNAAFYWFSGRYPDPNMAQYLERLSTYFLPFVTAPVVYLAAAAALHVLLARSQRQAIWS